MEFFNNLTPGRKLAAIFVALLVCAVLYEAVLAHLNGQPLEWEKHLAQGFYYAAIGFAVYHMFTRGKQRKEAEAAKAADAAGSGEIAAAESEEKPQA